MSIHVSRSLTARRLFDNAAVCPQLVADAAPPGFAPPAGPFSPTPFAAPGGGFALDAAPPGFAPPEPPAGPFSFTPFDAPRGFFALDAAPPSFELDAMTENAVLYEFMNALHD